MAEPRLVSFYLFYSTVVAVLCCCSPAITAAATAGSSLICTSESQPNPIASQYPDDATGTINGTTVIIPIPYDTARSLVPSQYGILDRAYRALIPGFPSGSFPALLQAVVDHDVQMSGVGIPDFQRAVVYLPFVDRLNDGYSCFRYSLPVLISTNLVAFTGATLYGTTYLGDFVPSCNPYSGDGKGTTQSTAYVFPGTAGTASPAFNSSFTATGNNPYGMNVFKNLTNQPLFGNGAPVCDNFITLYNSSVTTGQFAPTPVKGVVTIASPFYVQGTTFTDVYGYRMDNAFVERNNKPCDSLKGYSGSGPGD